MDLDGFVGSVSGFSSLQKRSGLAEHGGRSLKMAKAVNYNVSSTMSTEANSLYCGKWHGNMNGGQGGSRGLFTPSQWLELEHQALIYKHISSNVPIPSHLLNPIRKAFRFSPCNGFSAGTYRSNSLGWGSFNLGFSGNSDPEPGRCRRTDGKKWRCSRDAMADQKYCERHMNRGRHRSRKPVEGLPGHVASSIVSNRAASPPPTETVILGSNSFMYQTRSSASTETFRRDITSKEIENEHLQDLHSSSVRSSANLASNEDASSSFLEQYIPFKDNPQIEFSLPSSVSNSNPPKSFSASDEIPKTRSDHLALVWLDTEHIQSEETLHSISSYSSLPYPLKMGSTTGFHPEMTQNEEQNHDSSPRQSYFGGPLGEVLNKTGNQTDENSKSLHLISDYWDEIPPLMFSPTRILHKDPFETPSNCTSDSVSAEEKPTF